MERKYKLTGYFMMLLLPLVYFGFYQSYFIKFPRFTDRIRIYDHIHAFLAVTWIALLIAQPLLIAHRKNEWHRRLGRLSYWIFPLLVLSFIPREIVLLQSDNPAFFFYPFADSVVLVTLYSLAIYNKNQVSRHMRYMISSALVLLGPTVGRIGLSWFGWSASVTQTVQYSIIFIILISLILFDGKPYKKSRPYRVAIWLYLLHAIVFYILFGLPGAG